MLSRAREILAWSRTKALDVLNGAKPFDQVLNEMNGETAASKGNPEESSDLRKVSGSHPTPDSSPIGRVAAMVEGGGGDGDADHARLATSASTRATSWSRFWPSSWSEVS
jgi:hypothetical protein